MAMGFKRLRINKKRIAITIFIMAETAFLLFLGEIGLRCLGYGYSTTPFLNKQYQGERWYLLNDRYYSQFINTANCPQSYDTPNAVILSDKKPPKTYRIFLFGGSAAYGWFFPDYNIGNILETLLRNSFKDRRFEVITVAFHAMNSFTMRHLSDACAQLQPDLFLVYMGNNEMVGPYGLQSVLGSKCRSDVVMSGIVSANLWLSDLKLFQLCSAPARELFSRSVQDLRWGGYAGVTEVSDPRLERCYTVFQHNLDHICKVAQQAGAKTVLCTVGYNLRDWRPTISAHRVPLTEKEVKNWDTYYEEGKKYETEQEYEKAIVSYNHALEIDKTYADLLFRLASCYLAQEQYDIARNYFLQAVDHALSFCSANTRINGIIKGTAALLHNDNVVLADTAQALARNNTEGIPGNDCFYDHVHLRFEGNYTIALEVFSRVMDLFHENASIDPLSISAPLTLEECKQRMGYSDGILLDEIHTVQSILTSDTPQPVLPVLTALENRLKQKLANSDEDSILTGYRKALSLDPENAMVRYRLVKYLVSNGCGNETLEDLSILLKRCPCNWHYKSAWISAALEKDRERAFLESEDLAALYSEFSEAQYHAGTIAMYVNDFDRAITHFQTALALNDSKAHYYGALGRAYSCKGDFQKAESAFQTLLKLDASQRSYVMETIQQMISQWENEGDQRKADEGLHMLEQLTQVIPASGG